MTQLDAAIVSAVANSIAALGMVLVVYQLVLYKRQLQDDHERSRRENAIAFLAEWARGLKRNASLTRKFVELLDETQTQALIDLRPFTVSVRHRDLLVGCLEPAFNEEDVELSGKNVNLSESQVKVIKWQTVSYLNLLEAILSAWRHNTADRDMIEEQFQYLVAPESGMTIVENYRRCVGGPNALPAISEFAETILKRRADEQSRRHGKELDRQAGKPPIGQTTKRQNPHLTK